MSDGGTESQRSTSDMAAGPLATPPPQPSAGFSPMSGAFMRPPYYAMSPPVPMGLPEMPTPSTQHSPYFQTHYHQPRPQHMQPSPPPPPFHQPRPVHLPAQPHMPRPPPGGPPRHMPRPTPPPGPGLPWRQPNQPPFDPATPPFVAGGCRDSSMGPGPQGSWRHPRTPATAPFPVAARPWKCGPGPGPNWRHSSNSGTPSPSAGSPGPSGLGSGHMGSGLPIQKVCVRPCPGTQRCAMARAQSGAALRCQLLASERADPASESASCGASTSAQRCEHVLTAHGTVTVATHLY